MSGNVVVRHVARADAATIEDLEMAGVATCHEAAGRTGLAQPYLRPVYAGARASGSAVTALCAPGDNLMIHAAVECCENGDILVVAVTSSCTDGMVGELLATSLRARGVRAVVIDAGVRDVGRLTSMRFPVWARSVSAQGTVKVTAGAVNVPVVCAGVLVEPGDIIIADDDGVLRVPRRDATAVLKAAKARTEREEGTRERLANGDLGLDIYDLRPRLRQMGVRYIE